MNLWESRIHKRRPALHKRRGFPLRTKERRAMPMYVTYSDLVQIGIFIVALVGLCYTNIKRFHALFFLCITSASYNFS